MPQIVLTPSLENLGDRVLLPHKLLLLHLVKQTPFTLPTADRLQKWKTLGPGSRVAYLDHNECA